MVKKLNKMASKAKAAPANQIASAVKDSAETILRAGQGAFAKVQTEGQKVLETLVREGMAMQKKGQRAAEDKVTEMTTKMNRVASDITSQANTTWDKLETVFEDRVARALNKLGVPTNRDIELLTKRVEQLTAQLAKMGGKPAASKPAAKAAAKAAAKPAAKKAPAKKPAAKKSGAKAA